MWKSPKKRYHRQGRNAEDRTAVLGKGKGQGNNLIINNKDTQFLPLDCTTMRKHFLWVAVTADEYELPLAVADTARELGDLLGLSKSTVDKGYREGLNGKLTGRKFVKVEIEEWNT